MVTKEALLEYEEARKEDHLWWLKTLLRDKFVLIQISIIVIFFLTGLFGWLFAQYGFADTNLKATFEGPSITHLFGTDRIGRDYFTRILFASQTTVFITLLTILFGGFLIAVPIGLISGYYGGWKDWILMRIGEFFYALPAFLMLIFISATLKSRYMEFFEGLGFSGSWLMNSGMIDFAFIFFIFSLFFWVGTARIIRAQTLSLRENLYVDAARVLGASNFRIILHHIVPNLLYILLLDLSGMVVAAFGAEIGLSFLGLGITPPHPSFGLMFSESASTGILEMHAYLLIFPGLIIAAVIVAVKRLTDNFVRVLESRS